MDQAPLFGKYRLLRRLAVGGMAEVFLAEVIGREGFLRKIVIKRILPQFCEDPYFVELFINEAAISAKLAHANVVQIFDFDRVGGQYYLAMEYVAGSDLASLLRRSTRSQIPVERGVAYYIVAELLEALAYAHSRQDEHGVPLGIVHRDVSPGNVLLSVAGEVKLSDFGIARARSTVNLTQPGVLKGKAPYMSPEQVEGRPIDARSDLFSLGVVFYELCVRRRPFRGASDLEVMDRIRRADFVPPRAIVPTLPPRTEALILRAMARSPEERFADADELLLEVRAAAAYEGIELGPQLLAPLLARLAALHVMEAEAVTPRRGPPPLPFVEAALGSSEVASELTPRVMGAVDDTSSPSAPPLRLLTPPVREAVGESRSMDLSSGRNPRGETSPAQLPLGDVGRRAHTGPALFPLERTERLSQQLDPPVAPANHGMDEAAYGAVGGGAPHHRRPPDDEESVDTRSSTARPFPVPRWATSRTSGRWAAPFGLGIVFTCLVGAAVYLGIRASAPRFEVTVGWRLRDAEESWLRREVLTPFEREHHARVRVLRYERPEDVEEVAGRPAIDVVGVDLAAARPLVERGWMERIEPLARDAGREKELQSLLGRLRPAAVAMARYPALTESGLFFIPWKLGTRVLVARRSKVDQALARFAPLRPLVEQALFQAIGHGLPTDYAFEANPAQWDLYDLLVVSFIWSHVDGGSGESGVGETGNGQAGGRVMVRRHRDLETVEDMFAEIESLGAAPRDGLHVSDGLIDFFVWEGLFRELELLHPATWRPETAPAALDILSALQRGEIYLGLVDSSDLDGRCDRPQVDSPRSLGPDGGTTARSEWRLCDDLVVVPPPRGVPPTVDDRSRANRPAANRWTASLWGVSRTASYSELALELVLKLTSGASQGYFDRFSALPALQAPLDARGSHRPPPQGLVSMLAGLEVAGRGALPLPAARPLSFVDLRQRRDRLLDAWKNVVALRGYRDARGRVSRAEIARRLGLYLDD